jgi:hypothetical protein
MPMQNAHLRLGLLEYHRITEKTSTRIRVRVSSYIGEDEQAHLIGVFGNDSDIGAITAAVHEKAYFTLTFPDGAIKEITLGEHASCYRSSVILPGRKHPVRHLVAISEQLHSNGSAGRTILSRKVQTKPGRGCRPFLAFPLCPSGQSTSAGLLKPKAASSHFMASVVSLCWLRPQPMRCSPGSRRR